MQCILYKRITKKNKCLKFSLLNLSRRSAKRRKWTSCKTKNIGNDSKINLIGRAKDLANSLRAGQIQTHAGSTDPPGTATVLIAGSTIPEKANCLHLRQASLDRG